MKQATVIRIISWSLVAILLTCFLIGGIIGRFPIFSFNLGTTVQYPDSSKYSIADGTTIHAGMIDDIEIHWVSGNVRIEAYDGEDVSFSESSTKKLDEDSKMRYYIDDGKLSIQFCASRRLFPRLDDLSKELLIQVPSDQLLKELDIESVSADTAMKGISASEISIENVSGSVHLGDVISDDLRLETVSGALTAQGTQAKSLSAESISGKVDLEGAFDTVTGSTISSSLILTPGNTIYSVDAETVSGKVEIRLPEDMDGFQATHSSLSGEMQCDFPVQSENDTLTYQNGRADFEIETVSGSIHIFKLKKVPAL